MPKISVVMGVYNIGSKKILEKSIKSILEQTFQDFDFIICDDGSTDNTLQYLKEISKQDNRIRLLTNERNLGLAYSLNKCIEHSKSQYVARMDADDMCEKHRFQKQIDFLEHHSDEYAVVSSNAYLIDENDKILGKRKYPIELKKEDFLHNSSVIHPAVMMRRKALENVNNYRVSKETRRVEDYDLWMRLYKYGYKIYNIQEELYSFREDEKCLKRRKYKYRIDEVKVRYYGFKSLGLFPKGYLYVLKPLIVGLIPYNITKFLKNKFRKENVI